MKRAAIVWLTFAATSGMWALVLGAYFGNVACAGVLSVMATLIFVAAMIVSIGVLVEQDK